jgi:hypothetical protein
VRLKRDYYLRSMASMASKGIVLPTNPMTAMAMGFEDQSSRMSSMAIIQDETSVIDFLDQENIIVLIGAIQTGKTSLYTPINPAQIHCNSASSLETKKSLRIRLVVMLFYYWIR